MIFTQQTEALEHLFANIDVQQWARGSEDSTPVRLSYGLNVTDGAELISSRGWVRHAFGVAAGRGSRETLQKLLTLWERLLPLCLPDTKKMCSLDSGGTHP